jgi:opacity protein-like surface antigen
MAEYQNIFTRVQIRGGADYGVRGGYDWQMGSWVFGVVGEYGANDVRDAVTAFSTTPAYYTMFRKVDRVAALRLRSGYAFGADSANLVYLTGGMAHAKIDNEFTTSNGANSFTTNGDTSGFGWQAGVGYERKLGENVSVGLEYLFTSLDADDQPVRTGPGTAPATNPFLIVNPAGTDMRRSDKDFDYGAARATVNWRF